MTVKQHNAELGVWAQLWSTVIGKATHTSSVYTGTMAAMCDNITNKSEAGTPNRYNAGGYFGGTHQLLLCNSACLQRCEH
jgi:hypothetical protein